MGLRKQINGPANSLELIYSWYEPYHKVACIFMIVWDLFNVALWYPLYLPLVKGNFAFPKNMFAFCCLFVLIPAPSYWMLVYMVNKTRVIFDQSEVRIVNGPLPSWRKNYAFPLTDIKYISIEELNLGSVTEMVWNITIDETCHIKAILRNGEPRYLILNIPNQKEAQLALLRIRSWLQKNKSCRIA